MAGKIVLAIALCSQETSTNSGEADDLGHKIALRPKRIFDDWRQRQPSRERHDRFKRTLAWVFAGGRTKGVGGINRSEFRKIVAAEAATE